MKTKSSEGQWTALWLSFFSTVAMFIPYVGYSTKTMEIMEELSMNYTMAGTLSSVTALSGGLILFIAGNVKS